MTYQYLRTDMSLQRNRASGPELVTSIGSGNLKLGFSLVVELIKVTAIFVICFCFSCLLF